MPVDITDQLTSFYSRAEKDYRIDKIHMNIFLALLELKNRQKTSPFRISRKMIMRLSKVKGISTYHKCINDLVAYRYIVYKPSYHPGIQTTVCFLNEDPHVQSQEPAAANA
ncbi:MAG TPA: hypothetical protein VKR53_12370 [Puia sp.]|nr:hypothetical protein [Puia sp.]